MRGNKVISTVLDDCLERLQSGEAMESCLRRYPGYEGELRPMLLAAARLDALSDQRLSEPQKVRGKVMIREALAEQNESPERLSWLGALGRMPGVALAAMLALVLLVAATATAVAASRPGDPGYGARLWIERVPAQLAWSPAGRAFAQLRFADRRLEDVADYLDQTGQLADDVLASFMEAMEASAEAQMLTGPEREQVAVRLTAQSRQLTQLMVRTTDAQASSRLQLAARWTQRVAERVRAGQPPDGEWPGVNPLAPQFGEPQGPQPGPGPRRTPPAVEAPGLLPTRPLRPEGRPPDLTPPPVEAPRPGPGASEESPAGSGPDESPGRQELRPSDVPGWAPGRPTTPETTPAPSPGTGQGPIGPQPGQNGEDAQGTPETRPTPGSQRTPAAGSTRAPGPSEAPGAAQPAKSPQPPGPARTPSPPRPGRS